MSFGIQIGFLTVKTMFGTQLFLLPQRVPHKEDGDCGNRAAQGVTQCGVIRRDSIIIIIIICMEVRGGKN
jgi:hypothetical protein